MRDAVDLVHNPATCTKRRSCLTRSSKPSSRAADRRRIGSRAAPTQPGRADRVAAAGFDLGHALAVGVVFGSAPGLSSLLQRSGFVSTMEVIARRSLKLIGRALMSAMLMLVSASPALAGIGRVQDALMHEAQEVSIRSEAPAVSRVHLDHRSRSPAKPSHCGFAHGAYSAHLGPVAGSTAAPAVVGPHYAAFSPARFAAAPRDGPDHPPRT